MAKQESEQKLRLERNQLVAGKSRPRSGPERTRVRVGTASWSDPGFVADWYPRGLPPGARLPWYAKHFDLVEVNSSFYRIPSPYLTERWSKETPQGFLFDVKLHQLLSRHAAPPESLPRDLRAGAGVRGKKVVLTPDLEKAVAERFLAGIRPLQEAGKLGALLLQLSPSFSPREHVLSELDHLLGLLAGYRVAVELRHRSWVEDEQLSETLYYFTTRGISYVSVDAPAREHFMVMPPVDVITSPELAYLRAHGRNAHGFVSGRSVAERFDYQYRKDELYEIAERTMELLREAREVHVIFNNNHSNYAPRAGEEFLKLIRQEDSPPLSASAPSAQAYSPTP